MPEKRFFSGSVPEAKPLFLSSEEGIAIITTLLILTLMTLSGFGLLYFATMDIRVSGNDRVSRTLLHRVEAQGLYVTQNLRDMDSDKLLRESPSRPQWMHTEQEARGFLDEAVPAQKVFSILEDKEIMAFVKNWPANDSGKVSVFEDSDIFPFLGEGRGRVLVVDLGPSGVGSQDIGSAVFHEYMVFSEYEDGRGNVRFLETSLLRKQ